MKTNLYWIGLSFAFLLSACNQASPPSSTPTAIQPTVRQIVASPSLTASPAPTAIPTSTSTPAPTPTRVPLSWKTCCLLIKGANSNELDLSVANRDGSGLHKLEIEKPARGSWVWQAWPAPDGDIVLLRTQDYGEILFELDGNEFDYQMWILKLPEEQVIRKIPLLSGEARQRITDELPNLKDKLDQIPVVLGGVRDAGNFRWSKDGQRLAYTAATNGKYLDIYVYDARQDTITQLTKTSKDYTIISWIEGNRGIIFAETLQFDAFFGDNSIPAGIVYLDGTVKLFHPSIPSSPIWLWTSDDTYLTFDRFFESPLSNLREVNAWTGETRTIYEPRFSNVAYDPNTGILMLAFVPDLSGETTLPVGVYRLDPNQTEPRIIFPGYYTDLRWSKELQLFTASRGFNDNYAFLAFDANGKIYIDNIRTNRFTYPSPDGKWLLVEFDRNLSLYSPAGEFIQRLNDICGIAWLKDSSGFIAHTSRNGLGLYTQSQKWEREALVDLKSQCVEINLLSKRIID